MSKSKNMFLVAAVLAAGNVLAADWPVSTVAGLTNAISRSDWYETITLAAGTYDLSGIGSTAHLSNAKGLLIRGADATSWRDRADRQTAVVLVGDGTKPIFSTNQNKDYWAAIRGSTFENITFKNAKGGCITPPANASFAEGCYVLVKNCVFLDCQTTGYGGAVNVAKVDNCRFSGCSTTQFGGAAAFVEATDSLFENNTAGHSGGAVYIGQGTSCTRCTFTGNSARYWGGAAFNASLTDCTLVENHSKWRGGAATPDSVGITYAGCTFTSNFVETVSGSGQPGRGGAIAVRDDTAASACGAFVTNCTFFANKSAENGGALYYMTNVVDCRFRENSGNFGGAVSHATVVKSTFEKNHATHSGGAVAYGQGRGCTGCTFTGNTAPYWGGAAFNASLYDCTVVGNSITADDPAYGGAAVPDSASIVYSGCTFEGNVSTTMGGAISTRGDTAAIAKNALITNCTFRANKAGGGGALFNMRNVTNCHFENNTNSYFSGHCWHCSVRNSTVTGEGQMCQTRLENCTFDGAYSTKDASRGVVVSVNNSVMADDAAETVNCLFVNITNSQMAVDCQGHDMTIVNCTFADSIYATKGPVRMIGYGGRGPNVKIFNSIFANNFNGGVDRGFWIAREEFVGSLEIRNNLGTVLSIPESVEGCPVTASGNMEGNPKFLGADNRYGVPAYTVRYSSPAHASGLVDKLPATLTKDRAGNPRLREGQLDLGCYETWYEKIGLFLVVQ